MHVLGSGAQLRLNLLAVEIHLIRESTADVRINHAQGFDDEPSARDQGAEALLGTEAHELLSGSADQEEALQLAPVGVEEDRLEALDLARFAELVVERQRLAELFDGLELTCAGGAAKADEEGSLGHGSAHGLKRVELATDLGEVAGGARCGRSPGPTSALRSTSTAARLRLLGRRCHRLVVHGWTAALTGHWLPPLLNLDQGRVLETAAECPIVHAAPTAGTGSVSISHQPCAEGR